jgi:serine/threonine protein kinase
MFCPKCGQKNEDTAQFCVSCGQKIQTDPGITDFAPSSEHVNIQTEALASKNLLQPTPAEVSTIGIGRVLQDRYKINRELGTGGMGRVLLAFDEKMEFDVVVKEMLPYMIAPKERKYIEEHFKEEAKMLYRLKHMGLPRVMDFFIDSSIIYIIMEYTVKILSHWSKKDQTTE